VASTLSTAFDARRFLLASPAELTLNVRRYVEPVVAAKWRGVEDRDAAIAASNCL